MALGIDSMVSRHVTPVDDTLDHDLVSGDCWCSPTYDIRHDRVIVHHHRAVDCHPVHIASRDANRIEVRSEGGGGSRCPLDA